MSLAKEKDLFKKRTYLTSFCAGKVVFFRVRPRIMIGLETVLRVFEIS